ncbi:YdcF family protein [Sphingomonas swuensis]
MAMLAIQIYQQGKVDAVQSADVAIVLGAAIHGVKPSPVFEERIRHGLDLYRSKKVRKLLFTGGIGEGTRVAESVVARRYALRHGLPEAAILTEEFSRTTRANLFEARKVMQANDVDSALIVSDPLHMKRAMRMAADLGMAAEPSPTPTSRYRSWHAKAAFLMRELYFYNHYLITGQ